MWREKNDCEIVPKQSFRTRKYTRETYVGEEEFVS